MKALEAVGDKVTKKIPAFHYRQTYQTEINSLDDVKELFFSSKPKDGLYFRGMGRYEYICISTFYRYYLSLYPDIKWHDVKLGFGKVVPLPKIDIQEYRKLSFDILDEFEKHLAQNELDDLEFESIIYLAQHYELPTNLIDFTTDPRVALYFACSDAMDDDCSVYMYDIFTHIKGLAQRMSGHFNDSYEEHFKRYTTIDKEQSFATPIVKQNHIIHNQRVQNQKGYLYITVVIHLLIILSILVQIVLHLIEEEYLR